MFSCQEFLLAFEEHIDRALPEDLRRELEQHLAQCRSCQIVVDAGAKTLRIVTESGKFDLSETLPESTVSRIMARIREK